MTRADLNASFEVDDSRVLLNVLSSEVDLRHKLETVQIPSNSQFF